MDSEPAKKEETVTLMAWTPNGLIPVVVNACRHEPRREGCPLCNREEQFANNSLE